MTLAGISSMQAGKVKWFNDLKGIGFIGPAGAGPDIYVHITGLISKSIGLRVNDEVEYDITETPRGPRAVNVRVLRRQPTPLNLAPRPHYPGRD